MPAITRSRVGMTFRQGGGREAAAHVQLPAVARYRAYPPEPIAAVAIVEEPDKVTWVNEFDSFKRGAS